MTKREKTRIELMSTSDLLDPDAVAPQTRSELLEYVNYLNMRHPSGQRFWTCTVLYNTVIWMQQGSEATMFAVYDGVLGEQTS